METWELWCKYDLYYRLQKNYPSLLEPLLYDLVLQKLRCTRFGNGILSYTWTIVLNKETAPGPWTYLGKHRANRCPAANVMVFYHDWGRKKSQNQSKQKELAYSWQQVYIRLAICMCSNMKHIHTQHQCKIHHAMSFFKYAKSKGKKTPRFCGAAMMTILWRCHDDSTSSDGCPTIESRLLSP